MKKKIYGFVLFLYEKLCKHYYITFCLCFILVGSIAFSPFWINERSFIWVAETKDGLQQHYNVLMYLGKWGREILYNLFVSHKIEIPVWDFSIGYGSDIITTLHYYGLGDPLTLLSIIVPSKYTEQLYNLLVIFRLFLSGIAFSYYCFYMNKGKKQTLLGAYIYMFCGYALFAFARHPFFIAPMIYLPLLFVGAEKVMKKKSPYLFVGVVFLMTISNFYFSYTTLLLLVVYVGVRFFCAPHKALIKEGFLCAWKFFCFILWGVLMASIIFIPVVFQIFSSGRVGDGADCLLTYYIGNYEQILAGYFKSGENVYWTCLGFAPISIVAIVLLFLKKRRFKEIKVSFLCLTGMMLCPIFGFILSGGTYVSNRWIFAYAFLISYIFVEMWEEMMELSCSEKRKLVIAFGVIFVVLLLLNKGTNENVMASMVLLLFSLMILFQDKSKLKKGCERIVLFIEIFAVIILGIGTNVKYEFGMHEGNYISEFIESGTARAALYQTGDYALRNVDENFDTIERVDRAGGLINSSWQNGTYGIGYFASLENGTISQYLGEMGMRDFYSSKYQDLDSRTILNTLASVKYYVDETEATGLPYGYKKIAEVPVDQPRDKTTYIVYENQYALPLGYTYETYISEEDYVNMNAVQKQQALLQGIVLEKQPGDFSTTETEFSEEKLDYKVDDYSKVKQDGEKLIVEEEGGQITISFNGNDDCETYIYFNDLDVEGCSKKDLYFDSDNAYYTEKEWENLSQMQKNKLSYDDKYYTSPTMYNIKFSTIYGETNLKFLTSKHRYYHNQEEYIVNLGYHEKGIDSVTITFPSRGVYDLSNLEIICQPLESYIEEVDNLSKDVLENEQIGINSVSGEISVSEDKFLCLTVPYSKGWTAYVNGEKAELLQANTMFMALPLKAGNYKLELHYETPGLKLGALVSGISLLAFVSCIYISKLKYKRNANPRL